MANKKADEVPEVDVRGQISLPLDGQEYVLRPSMEAIMAIEARLRPLLPLTQEAVAGSLTLHDLGIITAEFMRAFGKANPNDPLKTTYLHSKPETLARLIYEAGQPKVCIRVATVLMGALSGGYEASGEIKAATTTDETQGAE